MRLIDADALTKCIESDKIDNETLGIITALGDGLQAETLNMTCDRHIQMIKDIPTIEAEPVKRGKWIYNSPVTMKCDQCGLVIKDWDQHRFKLCPNCGARMSEGSEE